MNFNSRLKENGGIRSASACSQSFSDVTHGKGGFRAPDQLTQLSEVNMFITWNHREEVLSSFFVMLTRTTMDLADWGRALLLSTLAISVLPPPRAR